MKDRLKVADYALPHEQLYSMAKIASKIRADFRQTALSMIDSGLANQEESKNFISSDDLRSQKKRSLMGVKRVARDIFDYEESISSSRLKRRRFKKDLSVGNRVDIIYDVICNKYSSIEVA